MLYKPVKVDVPAKFHEKIKAAIQRKTVQVAVKVNLQNSGGQQTLLLTRGQLKKLERARLIGKKSLTIHLSRPQVQANVLHKGGFIGMLIAAITGIASAIAAAAPEIVTGVAAGVATAASAAAAVAPEIATGVATGIATGLIEKAVSGNGLYLSKNGYFARVQPVKGGGLYLTPRQPHRAVVGDRLFLKHGNDIYGQEVIYNSPWIKSQIPMLELIIPQL